MIEPKNSFLIIYITLILGIFLISGCTQQQPAIEIYYEDMNEELQLCIETFRLKQMNQEFVINSNEEYNSLLEYKSPADFCDDFELPNIDFSQNTLLGKYAQSGGCSINFVRYVSRDDSNKKIIYSIEVIEEGFCKKLGASMNWILIQKVPSNYEIEFQVK